MKGHKRPDADKRREHKFSRKTCMYHSIKGIYKLLPFNLYMKRTKIWGSTLQLLYAKC